MSASFAYKALESILRLTKTRNRMLKDAARGEQRNETPKGKLAKRWEPAEFDGRSVWICHPQGGETQRVYVHEHGGGYVYGLMRLHFTSLSELSDYAGMTVILPDYPLPPQARAPEIMDWADRHFSSIVDCYGLENVSLGGCSAGANLALAILQKRVSRGDANPKTVALWSPWLKLTSAETPPNKADDYEAVITPFGLEPAVNAYIDNQTTEVVYRDFCDISVAVASPTGLVVPVLRNTETMSFADVEKNIAMYGQKAKDGTLSLDDMAGGTFTISNGGVFGSLMGTPIIKPPQSAILGMHATKMRPVVNDKGEIVARPMMYLALTYDHRLIDGREGVTFLKSVADKIADPHRLLLDL